VFDNQKLEITLGPWQDIILYIALFLVIFVYGAAAINLVESEVRSWFGKDPRRKPYDPPVRYEIMWTATLDVQSPARIRVSSDIEATKLALLRENGDGYIWYRPDIEGSDYGWGTALWMENPDTIKMHYGLDVMTDYAKQDLETTKAIFEQPSPWMTDEAPEDNGPKWIIEWSNNVDFNRTMGGEVHSYLTGFLTIKGQEIFKERGEGYFRWRSAESPDEETSWTYAGYTEKEDDIANAKHL